MSGCSCLSAALNINFSNIECMFIYEVYQIIDPCITRFGFYDNLPTIFFLPLSTSSLNWVLTWRSAIMDSERTTSVKPGSSNQSSSLTRRQNLYSRYFLFVWSFVGEGDVSFFFKINFCSPVATWILKIFTPQNSICYWVRQSLKVPSNRVLGKN